MKTNSKLFGTTFENRTWQDAIARSLQNMEKWADENGVHLHTYFLAANPK